MDPLKEYERLLGSILPPITEADPPSSKELEYTPGEEVAGHDTSSVATALIGHWVLDDPDHQTEYYFSEERFISDGENEPWIAVYTIDDTDEVQGTLTMTVTAPSGKQHKRAIRFSPDLKTMYSRIVDLGPGFSEWRYNYIDSKISPPE